MKTTLLFTSGFIAGVLIAKVFTKVLDREKPVNKPGFVKFESKFI